MIADAPLTAAGRFQKYAKPDRTPRDLYARTEVDAVCR
jgi:hypothetical protein